MMNHFLLTATSLFLLSTFAAAGEPNSSAADSIRIDNLIRDLGSKSFKKRTDADAQLRVMPEAIPYLRRASDHPDPEVRERIKNILSIRKKKPFTPKMLERARAYANAGKIELAMEQLLAIQPPLLDEGLWQAALDIGVTIKEKTEAFYRRDFPKPIMFLETTVPKFFETRLSQSLEWVSVDGEFRPTEHRFGGCLRADRAQVSWFRGILLSSDGIQIREIEDSIVLALHGVRFGNEICRTILICADNEPDTDFIRVRDSILICRRSLSNLRIIENSVVISSGQILCNRNVRKVKSVVQQYEIKPINFVRWFETTEVGIEVGSENSAIQISKLDASGPFASSGCKLGDEVLTVEDIRIETVEQFRRLLRRGVIDGKVDLAIVRDKKKIEISVGLQP